MSTRDKFFRNPSPKSGRSIIAIFDEKMESFHSIDSRSDSRKVSVKSMVEHFELRRDSSVKAMTTKFNCNFPQQAATSALHTEEPSESETSSDISSEQKSSSSTDSTVDHDHSSHSKKPPSEINHIGYKMNHSRRGKVIIFNHEKFKNQPERKGTNVDVENLKNYLPKLGFKEGDLTVHTDLKLKDLLTQLKNLSEEDHSKSDCLMIFVLTHGTEDDKKEKIYAKDKPYSVNVLWQQFTANKCSSLALKPKIFFIIACRGQEIDMGAVIKRTFSLKTERDAIPIIKNSFYTIPISSDFLIVHSTAPGFASFRDTEKGTWYIQALCEEIRTANLQKTHLMDLLTQVNRRIALLFGNNSGSEKQCSHISSTLTGFIHMG